MIGVVEVVNIVRLSNLRSLSSRCQWKTDRVVVTEVCWLRWSVSSSLSTSWVNKPTVKSWKCNVVVQWNIRRWKKTKQRQRQEEEGRSNKDRLTWTDSSEGQGASKYLLYSRIVIPIEGPQGCWCTQEGGFMKKVCLYRNMRPIVVSAMKTAVNRLQPMQIQLNIVFSSWTVSEDLRMFLLEKRVSDCDWWRRGCLVIPWAVKSWE